MFTGEFKMTEDISFITIKGEEFALVPMQKFEKFSQAMEELEDKRDIEEAKATLKKIAKDEEQFYPLEIVEKLCSGENAIKLFREYRNLSVNDLAQKINKSADYVRKLENGNRRGTVDVLKDIARALQIDCELLL